MSERARVCVSALIWFVSYNVIINAFLPLRVVRIVSAAGLSVLVCVCECALMHGRAAKLCPLLQRGDLEERRLQCTIALIVLHPSRQHSITIT